jgi:hypothetical protein
MRCRASPANDSSGLVASCFDCPLTRSSFAMKTGSASTAKVFGAGLRPANSRLNTASVEAEGRLIIS